MSPSNSLLPKAARIPSSPVITRTYPAPGVPVRTPIHPGQFLDRCYLKPLRLTQGQVARLLGVSRRRMNEIIVGRRGLSADTALRCALTFGLDAGFWMGLQSSWDMHRAWKAWRSATGPGAAARSAPSSFDRYQDSEPHYART